MDLLQNINTGKNESERDASLHKKSKINQTATGHAADLVRLQIKKEVLDFERKLLESKMKNSDS